MPYVTCANCRLTTYTAALRLASDECPRCGTRLPAAAPVPVARGRAAPGTEVDGAALPAPVVGRRALLARDHVSLLRIEPELAALVPAGDASAAEAALRVPVVALRPGRTPWRETEAGALLLIVAGAVMRLTEVQGRSNAVLLGAGDVVARPSSEEPGWAPVALAVQRPGAAAVLGNRFRAATRRWPELSRFVEERLTLQAHRSAVHAAIGTLPRVEDRVLAVLWHAAERWGRVRPDGIFVELDMTHGRLGDMVGARRSTVTLALQQLLTDRDVQRVDGGWLLRPESVERLGGADPKAKALVAP